MKFIFLLFFFPTMLFAQPITVHSLAQDSCWIKKMDGKVAFSSFNQNIATNIYDSQFQNIAEKIKTTISQNYGIALDAQTLDIYTHCGTYGSSFVFNFNSGEHNLCVWSYLDDNQLKFDQINTTKKGDRSFCSGHRIGELIIKISPEHSITELEQQKFFQTYVSRVEPIIDGVFKITLKDRYNFKEVEVKKVLDKELFIKSVDLNSVNHPVGESMSLYSLEI